jgi:hypothetical protein
MRIAGTNLQRFTGYGCSKINVETVVRKDSSSFHFLIYKHLNKKEDFYKVIYYYKKKNSMDRSNIILLFSYHDSMMVYLIIV